MLSWAKDLFPFNRSITGDGVRQTLAYLSEKLPGLAIKETPTNTQVFDWKVPREWAVDDAYIIDPDGKKIIDLKNNNLHLVSYSISVNKTMSLEDLQSHLYSLPDQPTAIPYVTSYYKDAWGFCLTDMQRRDLQPGQYHVVINSRHFDGFLSYGELILPGEDPREILLSTYICHPSMANNELSGPVLTTAIAQWLQDLPRRFTYRIIFVPETIGALTYLAGNLEALKKNCIAGYVLSCVGDNRAYSYIPSRLGNTYADRVARAVLDHEVPSYTAYTYLDRGSDERQYCSPGIDLPVCSVLRTRYGDYPEYHTSLDNFDVVTAEGLGGAFAVYQKIIQLIETNRYYRATCLGEPQLGRRSLYPTTNKADNPAGDTRKLIDVLAYADGQTDIIDIATYCKLSTAECHRIAGILLQNQLVETVEPSETR